MAALRVIAEKKRALAQQKIKTYLFAGNAGKKNNRLI
jgi:hypothetical protein